MRGLLFAPSPPVIQGHLWYVPRNCRWEVRDGQLETLQGRYTINLRRNLGTFVTDGLVYMYILTTRNP